MKLDKQEQPNSKTKRCSNAIILVIETITQQMDEDNNSISH
jgi:hypothetical protein